MAFQGPKTTKTYGRPTDRWPDDLEEEPGAEQCKSQGYVGWFSGTNWYVKHQLGNTDLIVTVWIDENSFPASPYMYSVQQLTDTYLHIRWAGTEPVRGKVVIYSLCDTSPVSDIIFRQDTPEEVWTIPHSMGTDFTQVLTSFWFDGLRIDPLYITADEVSLTATFSTPCVGVACIVRIDPRRIRGRASAIFKQEEASSVWTFEHTLNTSDLLCQAWVDADPIPALVSLNVTNTSVSATFTSECIGSFCIMDPFPVAECSVYIRQIVDWPESFPIGPHTHTKEEVFSSQDSDRLGGLLPDKYLRVVDRFATVCPLVVTAVEGAEGGEALKVPTQFLPDSSSFRIYDTDGSVLASRLRIDNTHSPLYLQKDYLNKIAILSMRFDPQKLTLTGNATPRMGQTEATISTTATTGWSFTIGEGLQATVTSPTTFNLSALPPPVIPAIPPIKPTVYTTPSSGNISPDMSWTVEDPLLAIPGSYVLTVYEQGPTGGRQVVAVGNQAGQVQVETLENKIILTNTTAQPLIAPSIVVFGIY